MGYSPYMTYVKYPRPRVSTKDFSGQFSTEWGSTPYIATEAKWNRFIVGTISVRQTCKKELIPELGMKTDSPEKDASIAGQSAEHYIAMDDSLAALLLNHGIEAVEDMGRPFDPHRHDAVSVRYDPYQPDQIILEVTQRGYRRNDKVFRPAKVIVNDLSHFPGVSHAR